MSARAVAQVLELAHELGALVVRDLLLAIRLAVGDRAFTCPDLLLSEVLEPHERARIDAAIVEAVGELNAMKLGKLLARYQDADIDGLVAVRIGSERDGTIWHVRTSATKYALPPCEAEESATVLRIATARK